jgi:hypothetical protein
MPSDIAASSLLKLFTQVDWYCKQPDKWGALVSSSASSFKPAGLQHASEVASAVTGSKTTSLSNSLQAVRTSNRLRPFYASGSPHPPLVRVAPSVRLPPQREAAATARAARLAARQGRLRARLKGPAVMLPLAVSYFFQILWKKNMCSIIIIKYSSLLHQLCHGSLRWGAE